MIRKIALFVTIVTVSAGLAVADESTRKLSLGLAYLATSGNSSSQTAGLDVKYEEAFGPWGVEAVAAFVRSKKDGELNAERTSLGVRGNRQVAERWQVFAGASGLRDKFAGLDSRFVAEGGATFQMIKNDAQELSFDAGMAWNREKQVTGATESYASGIGGVRYRWTITETSAFTQRVMFFPSFDDSNDWRVESESALQAALTARTALKLAYQVRRDNRPVPGFKKTDTTVVASLVLTL